MSNFNSVYHKYKFSRYQSDAGFTLVEVLVTLAIVAALSVSAVGMMAQLRPILMARERIDATVEVEALAGYIERMIRDAQMLSLNRLDPDQGVTMVGDPEFIEFVAAVRVGSESFGLRDVRLFVDRSLPHRIRLMQSLLLRRPGKQAEAEVIELAQVDELSFQYWQKRENQSTAAGWYGGWSERRRLPMSISFDLSITRLGSTVTARRTVNLPGGLP